MIDREKVVKELESLRDICNAKSNMATGNGKVAWAGYANAADDALALLKAMAEILAQLTKRCDELEQKIKDMEKQAVDWTMEHDTNYTARVCQTDERIERLETIIHQQDDEIRQMSARIRALTTPEDPAECGIGYPLVPAAGLDMISHQEYMAMEETET